MVKFSSDQDPIYELVSDRIYDLVKRTLPRQSSQQKSPPIINLSSHYDENDKIEYQVLEGLGKMILSTPSPASNDQPSRFIIQTQETGGKSRESSISLPKDIPTELLKTRLQEDPKSTNQMPGQVDDIKEKKIAAVIPSSLTESSESFQPTEEQQLLEFLREYHMVFIVDDTKSMRHVLREDGDYSRTCWDQLIEAMAYIGDIAARGSDQGVDMHFLFRRKHTSVVKSGEDMMKLLAKVDIGSSGDAPMSRVLWEVLNEQLFDYRQWAILERMGTRAQAPKPLNLIVITDGTPKNNEDREDIEAALARLARRLDASEFHVRVAFLQVGEDAEATNWLHNRMSQKYGQNVICDTMVSFAFNLSKLSFSAHYSSDSTEWNLTL